MNCSACESPLLVSFDFTNEPTWVPTIFNITSDAPIPNAELSSFTVPTYGQTAVDNGNALLWNSSLAVDGTQPHTLTLKRSASLILPLPTVPAGNMIPLPLIQTGLVPLGTATIITPTKGGKYLQVSGAGLCNFFKVQDKPFQLLPYRYVNGFSVETALFMQSTDFAAMPNWKDGVFFYMGTRAENKFSNALHPALELLKKDDPQITFPTKTGIESNAIALRLGLDGSLSFRYVDDAGVVQDISSPSNAVKSGWSVVLLTFLPYAPLADGQQTVIDETVLTCAPARLGKLALYVNGCMVIEKCDFMEFSFKPFEEAPTPKPTAPTYKQTPLPVAPQKQTGVTYTMSWGGGVTGLKNAFQYNHQTSALEPQERFAGLTIENNFSGIFQGGIQYLKVWNGALTFLEARENFNQKAKSYGLYPVQGGRMIRSN